MDDLSYEALSEQERIAIIDGRLKQLEAQHFEQGLNRRSLLQASDVDGQAKEQQLAEIEAALRSLQGAIDLHRAERRNLTRDAGGG